MADGRARRFGAFEALQLLVGKGGQGRLFAARCLEEGAFEGLHVGDEVVLKAMPVRADDPDKAYRRLARRTAALVAARHPGIVRYYGCFETEGGGIDDAMHVVVMELLRGETLEERLRREPLGLDGAESLAILRACLEALVHAASFGIVHRDIKPSNVFLCEDGGVKLIDFEVARQATSAQTTTESGAMQGTFDYMAPDFHPNFRPDPKFRGDQCSDVFSLAVTFHEMLAGRRPYAAAQTLGDQSMMAFFQRWTKAEGADPRRAIRIDGVRVHSLRHLQRVLRKALQPERSARYQTYAEFLAALSRVEPRVLEGGVGRYRLSKCVGKGGFGVVYKAFRESDGAAVAIKVLLRAEYAERFDREGRVLMRFDDDRIVTFVEAFAGGDPMAPTHFLVMRYLEGMPGSSLKDRLFADPSRRGLPRAETLAAFVRFAEGLQLLHDEGVYHRDVKPANLYFPAGEPQRACLMDLGVVRTDETQTNGGLPGTLDYMAPELATGGSRGDASADLYALGLCLYEALTGRTAYPRLPRGSEGVAAFYARARSGEEPDLSGLDGEPELQALVRSMTAVDRSERPASAREAARLLRAVPFREEGPREEVATGNVYSEDTTDDLVLPPTPPPSSAASAPSEPAAAPAEEEGEGEETQAVPAEAGEETVAAVPEGETSAGETAAFPPEGEEEEAPEPAAAAEDVGETGVAPEAELAAAADAEADTRAPGEGETAAAAAGEGETAAVSGEGETAAAAEETQASPTVAADGGLTATAVAETAAAPDGGTTTAAVDGLTATAATMAAEAGTTTAVAEGFTSTAATMAADGETAATAAVEETAATAAFDAGEPPVPPPVAARPARRSAPGVREIRPASRWRSVAAAACVLLLCGAAAGVFFFQEKLSDWFHRRTGETPVVLAPTRPEPADVGSDSPVVVRMDDLQLEVNDFVNLTTPDNWSDWDSRRKEAKDLAERIKESKAENESSLLDQLNGWETNSWVKFVSKRIDSFKKQIGEESEPEGWKKLKTDVANETVKVSFEYQKQYKSLISILENKINENNAYVEARRFLKEYLPAAKDQTARERLLLEAEKRRTENGKWPAVANVYDNVTNRLRTAISAYEAERTKATDLVVRAEEAAKEPDSAQAYAELTGILAELETAKGKAPKNVPDAVSVYESANEEISAKKTDVENKLNESYEKFKNDCHSERNSGDHANNITTAEKCKADKRLPNDLQIRYAEALNELKTRVSLKVENTSDVDILVRLGNEDSKKIRSGEDDSFEVDKWTKRKLEATPASDVVGVFPEDYFPTNLTVSIGKDGKSEPIRLARKPEPKVTIRPPSLGAEPVPVEVLNGKNWVRVEEKGIELTAEPRKPFSAQWRVSTEFPEDYKTTNGWITIEAKDIGNRGNSLERRIPDPARKNDPVVTFENSDGPKFSVKLTPGIGKTSLSFEVEPRTPVEATFARTDPKDTEQWFDIETISFRTGNRGWTTNVVIRQKLRPIVHVTNTSKERIVLRGKALDPGATESFFGDAEDKTETVSVKPTNVSEHGFYKDGQTVVFSYGKAGSVTNLPVSLAIDGEKMKVKELDNRFDNHACFVSWTNQLECLKSELKTPQYKKHLKEFRESCDLWKKRNEEDNLPLDKDMHLSDFASQCRCLLLERKLAEILDDNDEKGKIEEEIRGWVVRLENQPKLKGSNKDKEEENLVVWRGMEEISRANPSQ